MFDTIDLWERRVRSYVILTNPSDAREIAKLCQNAQLMCEPNPSVWHNASRFYGTLDSCPCHPCSKARVR